MTVYGDSPSTFGTGGSTSPTAGSASDTAQQVKDTVSDTAQQAKSTVSDAAQTVKDKATGLADTAKDKARETAATQVDTRSTQAGDSLATVAGQARDVSGQLREKGSDTAAKLVDSAAGYTDKIAEYLRSADGNTILSDVERYAKKQPWAVAAGGLLLGFAASRLLRASRDNLDSGTAGTDYDYRGVTGYGTDYSTGTLSSRELSSEYGGYAPVSDPVADAPIYAGMPSTPTLGETSRGNF